MELPDRNLALALWASLRLSKFVADEFVRIIAVRGPE